MKALILNSGIGKRMGDITSEHPKCMTEIEDGETILSRQLKQVQQSGIEDIVITTGPFEQVLIEYCESLKLPLQYIFVNNPVYDKTNYIYSIYLARKYLDEEIVLLHGDLVFETNILKDMLQKDYSNMVVSSIIPLPDKDFKAVVKDNRIDKIGVEFFDNAMAAQPLYKINKKDWVVWLNRIIEYCEKGQVSCYAENAFNEVSDKCLIYIKDVTDSLCSEIDTPEDLIIIKDKLSRLNQ